MHKIIAIFAAVFLISVAQAQTESSLKGFAYGVYFDAAKQWTTSLYKFDTATGAASVASVISPTQTWVPMTCAVLPAAGNVFYWAYNLEAGRSLTQFYAVPLNGTASGPELQPLFIFQNQTGALWSKAGSTTQLLAVLFGRYDSKSAVVANLDLQAKTSKVILNLNKWNAGEESTTNAAFDSATSRLFVYSVAPEEISTYNVQAVTAPAHTAPLQCSRLISINWNSATRQLLAVERTGDEPTGPMYLVVVDPASGSCTRKFEVKEAFHKMVLDVGWDAANENVAMLIWDAGSHLLTVSLSNGAGKLVALRGGSFANNWGALRI